MRTDNGWTALHKVLLSQALSKIERKKIVVLLIEYGANVNANNPSWWEAYAHHDSSPIGRNSLPVAPTPLSIAKKGGFVEIVQILESNGAK